MTGIAIPAPSFNNLFPRSAEQMIERRKKYQDLLISQTRGNMSRLSLAPISANISRKRRAEDEIEEEEMPRQKRFRPTMGTFRTTDSLESAWKRYIVSDSPVQAPPSSRSLSLPPPSSKAANSKSAREQATQALDDRQSSQPQTAQPQARTQRSPEIIGPSALLSDPFEDSGMEISRPYNCFILRQPADFLPAAPVFRSSPPLDLAQPTTGPTVHAASPLSMASPDRFEMVTASDGSVDGHGHNLRSRRTRRKGHQKSTTASHKFYGCT